MRAEYRRKLERHARFIVKCFVQAYRKISEVELEAAFYWYLETDGKVEPASEAQMVMCRSFDHEAFKA